MLNIAITPTAEALLQQLMQAGEGEPALIIEQALQYFCDRRLADREVDTCEGFPTLSEASIVQENEQRWQRFQEQGGGASQAAMTQRFERLIDSTDV
jgi:hypothetical protein